MWNVFEKPYLLLIIAAVSVPTVFVYRCFSPALKRRWQFIIPAAIVLLAFAADWIIATDTEKINAAFDDCLAAYAAERIEPIQTAIADDYSDPYNADKTLLIAFCKAMFTELPCEKITVVSRNLIIADSTAALTAEAIFVFEPNAAENIGKSFLIIKGVLTFYKRNDRWLILSSEVLELDRKPIK